MKVQGVTVRRSYLETPIMDEHKWGKIPHIPADVVFGDLEDSCPVDLKVHARAKVVSLLQQPDFLGARELACRPNALETPWGRDDLTALAKAKAPYMIYPKVRTADEIREVMSIFEREGASPEVMLIVETPQAILDLARIASCPGVSGLMFGYGDYAAEVGIGSLRDGNMHREEFLYARTKTLTVAKAFGLEAAEGLMLSDLKDLAAAREAATVSRSYGFTAMAAVYPPHVGIINDIMSPTPEEVLWARRAVDAHEAARTRGVPAAVDGHYVGAQRIQEAQRKVAVARALGIDP